MLTRIAYYAIGMIDELPSAQSTQHWVGLCQTPRTKTVKETAVAAPSARTRGKERAREEEEKYASSSSEESEKESSKDSKKIESDEDEQEKKTREALQSRPAISAERARWEACLDKYKET